MTLGWRRVRDEAFYEQTVLGRAIIRRDLLRYRVVHDWPEKLAIWLAHKLPRVIAMRVLCRVAAEAWAKTNLHPDQLTYPVLYDSWQGDR